MKRLTTETQSVLRQTIFSTSVLSGILLSTSVLQAQLLTQTAQGTPTDIFQTLTNGFITSTPSPRAEPNPPESLIPTGQVGGTEMSLTNFSLAPVLSAPRARDMGETLAILLGTNAAFSAAATVSTTDRTGTVRRVEMQCAFAEGKARTETDLRTIQQAGSGRPIPIIVISSPAEDRAIYFSPVAKTYCRLGAADLAGLFQDKLIFLKRARVGEKAIDGHRCSVYQVTVREPHGTEWFALVFEAPDLNNAPIQIMLGNTTVQFTKIVPTKPDSSLFEVPPDCRKLYSIERVLESASGQ